VFMPPVDTPRATSVYLGLPSVHGATHIVTATFVVAKSTGEIFLAGTHPKLACFGRGNEGSTGHVACYARRKLMNDASLMPL
jgi:hypothetical protein